MHRGEAYKLDKIDELCFFRKRLSGFPLKTELYKWQKHRGPRDRFVVAVYFPEWLIWRKRLIGMATSGYIQLVFVANHSLVKISGGLGNIQTKSNYSNEPGKGYF